MNFKDQTYAIGVFVQYQHNCLETTKNFTKNSKITRIGFKYKETFAELSKHRQLSFFVKDGSQRKIWDQIADGPKQ